MVGDPQRPAVRGTVADPAGLDPPPEVVEELEQREDRLRELLVEAPLVLVVLAPQPHHDRLHGVAKASRQRLGRGLGRGQGVEPGLDAVSQLA